MTRERYLVTIIRRHVDDRVKQHKDNLAGWSEPDGFLVPTEPDPESRAICRLELRAALHELDRILALLGEVEEVAT